MRKASGRFDSDMPASVAQARELWEQAQRLSAQISELQPLLALLEPPEIDSENDPVAKMLSLLEGISASQRSLGVILQRCDQKLTRLIEFLTARD